MLSLEQCRKIDPGLNDLSDEDLLKVRDELYNLGNIGFQDWIREKFQIPHVGIVKNFAER